MRRIIEYICFSSLFAALCAAILVAAFIYSNTFSLTHLQFPILCLVFGGTLTVYSLHYYAKSRTALITERNLWSKRHSKLIVGILLFGIIISIYGFFHLHLLTQIVTSCSALLAFAYSFPIFRFKKKSIRLKEFGLLKPFLLALVWVAVTTLLPLIELDLYHSNWIIESIARLLLLFPLCLLFDLKDHEIDAMAQIQTIPNLLNPEKTIWICYGAAIISILLYVIHSICNNWIDGLTWLICALLLIGLSRQASSHKEDLYYVYKVDGLMLIYGIIQLLISLI